ncbi:riboflavin synthase [Paucisalibacillus sp. EB02]|uniref:riboflavin synthase n=1 Tax=Paucisalibacillus sp. EB02 TaxID=1347087 RepID=UPI0005A8CE1C|nr:riboflavin synthase [Paucisalibacillus sp. EB02]
MFTGIIEEKGTVKSVQKVSENSIEMAIEAQKILDDVKLGDSISVNGVCLTVTNFTSKEFQVDVMPETFKSTSLKDLSSGSTVNLERAMAANGRFGGHFVSGHVDGTGLIIRRNRKENAIYYDIRVPEELEKYLMLKGSITVDGTSLTIFNVNKNVVTISLIPHTVHETVVGEKKQGEIVNIECDTLAKYVHHLFNQYQDNTQQKTGISTDLLRQNGFM